MQKTQIIRDYKSDRKMERLILLILLVASVLFGLVPDLDMYFAKLFYYPENPATSWPEKYLPLWQFFYHTAPVISAGVLLPSIFVYVGSYVSKRLHPYRKKAAFLFLGFVLGPGLLINTIFKPYWGRPRPRQVVELGGTEKMHAFWQKGISGNGYSFPCGHSSVGFALVGVYFILKRRRKKIAYSFLGASLFLGFLMGVGRMADGAHFFSDVLWSGVMAFGPFYWLYYKLRVYDTSDQSFVKNWKSASLQGAVLFVALLAAVLLATPHKQTFSEERPITKLKIAIDRGIVTLIPTTETGVVKIEVETRGFGFPESKVEFRWDEDKFSSIRKGFFSDFEANYNIYYHQDMEFINLEISEKGSLNPKSIEPKEFRLLLPSSEQ
ncbi:MAG: phosphatase PAP2 family protein [Bdellovibrionales bacterium]